MRSNYSKLQNTYNYYTSPTPVVQNTPFTFNGKWCDSIEPSDLGPNEACAATCPDSFWDPHKPDSCDPNKYIKTMAHANCPGASCFPSAAQCSLCIAKPTDPSVSIDYKWCDQISPDDYAKMRPGLDTCAASCIGSNPASWCDPDKFNLTNFWQDCPTYVCTQNQTMCKTCTKK